MLGLRPDQQPLRSVYIGAALFNLWFLRLPYWTLRHLLPKNRIRPSWTLSRCLRVKAVKYLFGLKIVIGGSVKGFGRVPDHKRLETDKGELGLYIDGVPELLIGDVAEWASKVGVGSTRIPGYWQHDPSTSPALVMGEPPRSGEIVLLHLHGGSFVAESAHPANITSSIPRLIMSYAPSVRRVFAPEYRKTSPGAHAFPTQLIDALAAYAYLVRTVGFSPSQIIISGDSAGGNLALALTRYLKATSGLLTPVDVPRALVLLSPWGDLLASHAGPGTSYETNADADFLPPPTKGAGEGTAALYAGGYTAHGQEFLSNKYISPAATTCEDWDFKGFPKTYISVGGAELFYDMNLELAKRMRRDVGEEEVVLGVTPDAFHDFIGFEWWVPERDVAAKEIADWIEAY